MVDQMVQTLAKNREKVDFFASFSAVIKYGLCFHKSTKKSYEKTWWWDDTVKNRIKVFF